MSILSTLGTIGSALVKPVTAIFVAREQRRQAKDAIAGQVALAKKNNEAQVNVQTSDWETLSKSQETSSWKDEYVTISVFSIFNVVVLGCVLEAFGFHGGVLAVDGVMKAVATLDSMDGNVSSLMWLVAAAAVSIKGFKEVTK